MRTLYRCAADSRAASQPILIMWSSLIIIVIIITVIQILFFIFIAYTCISQLMHAIFTPEANVCEDLDSKTTSRRGACVIPHRTAGSRCLCLVLSTFAKTSYLHFENQFHALCAARTYTMVMSRFIPIISVRDNCVMLKRHRPSPPPWLCIRSLVPSKGLQQTWKCPLHSPIV